MNVLEATDRLIEKLVKQRDEVTKKLAEVRRRRQGLATLSPGVLESIMDEMRSMAVEGLGKSLSAGNGNRAEKRTVQQVITYLTDFGNGKSVTEIAKAIEASFTSVNSNVRQRPDLFISSMLNGCAYWSLKGKPKEDVKVSEEVVEEVTV